PRARYENEGPPAAVSFLLVILGIAALCIAAVYLRASTLHDREIKISAYEETISEWTAFRPTFARLSINVTAHFGVAPVNTTSPGLDPNPPPPGTPLALAVSEDADPIHDEEGDAGGLPNYVPLKLERGVAPPPWRTARRFPPPEEDSQDDSQEDSQEVSKEGSEEEGGQPANEDGGDAAGEAGDDEGLVTSGTATSSGDVGGGGSAGGGGGERRRRRWRRRLENGRSGRENVPTGDDSPAAAAEAARPLSDVMAEGASVGEGGEQQSRTSGSGGRRRVDALEDEEETVGDEEGGGEEDDGLAAAALPAGFIPEAAFDDAPSVRFVFSARLDPAPTSSKGNKKGSQGGGGGASGGRERLLLQSEEEGKARWRWRWRRRGETEDGRRRMKKKKAASAAAPVLAEMVTEWTPLTRIREEHAPMPAPETKCMQVFGGVHNYKTKMCEVYERLSRVCVQVNAG
ncbi:unnamed protein product, partial [Ectocarpus sp. 8 AP-2014]